MARGAPSNPAARLADRLNYIPIAVFGLWLAPMLHLWLQLFGPMLPFDWDRPSADPLPWFVAASIAGISMLALPEGWYRPRGFEASLYRRLGVRTFRRLATNGDAIIRAVRRRHPGYTVHSGNLRQAQANTRLGEKSHLAFLLFGAVTTLYVATIEWWIWTSWTAVTNVVGNLYPILLQRYTRARLARLGVD